VRMGLRDERIRAVVDLDGRLIGRDLVMPVRLRVPLLALFHPGGDAARMFAASASSTVVQVPGTAHESFTDAPLLARLRPSPPVAGAGAMDAERAVSFTRSAVLAFLDCRLRAERAACSREQRVLDAAGARPVPRAATPRIPGAPGGA